MPRTNARGWGQGHFFEAESEAENKILASRPACPRALYITDFMLLYAVYGCRMDFIRKYDIELEKEQYYAGEMLRGWVVIENAENLRITGTHLSSTLSARY